MGLLTEIFAATPEAAAAADPDEWDAAAAGVAVLETGGFEPVLTFAALEEVLVGTDATQAENANIRDGASGETWIYELRKPLVAALAQPREDWSDVAADWAAALDLPQTELEAGAGGFVAELSRFVRAARAKGLWIYVWGSL